MLTAWKNEWKNKQFRTLFTISSIILVIVAQHHFYYLGEFQKRPGYRINDWLLDALPSVDLSIPIFFFIYISMYGVLISLLWKPRKFVQAMQLIAMLLFMRTLSIWLVPLEPPARISMLTDPFTEFFVISNEVVTKDLFFSGHTAFITLFFLLSDTRFLRMFSSISLVVIPFMLLIQHVHYTIDVLVAPFVAIGCYRLSNLWQDPGGISFEIILRKFKEANPWIWDISTKLFSKSKEDASR